jgi:hypothetical protein
MSQVPTDTPSRLKWGRLHTASAVVAVIAGAVWYAWPLIGGDARTVAVITDEVLIDALPHLNKEIRERGREVVALSPVPDWCTLAAGVGDLELDDDVRFLVLAVTERGDCSEDPVVEVLETLEGTGVDPVVVILPSSYLDTEAVSLAPEVRTAVVGHLLGGPDQLNMPCEWWDDCPDDGEVPVRSGDGSLTDAGLDRIARVVASVVG